MILEIIKVWDMQKKILNKILIVGKGNSGSRFKNLLKNNYILTVISSKRFKQDIKKLDKKFELIIISSPASFHKNHLKRLLNFSDKFLIEKPLFTNKNQFNFFLKLNKNNLKKNIFINYNLRETALYKILGQFLKKNKNKKLNFVRLYAGQHISMWPKNKNYLTTYSKKFFGGGAMFQLSHEIDLALYLFGVPDKHLLIRKQLDKFMDKVDDISILNFFYSKSKLLLEININMLDNHTRRYVELIYRDFTAKFNLFENSFCLYKNNKMIKKKIIKSDIVKSNLHVVNKVMNNNFSGLCSLNEALNQSFYLTNLKSII